MYPAFELVLRDIRKIKMSQQDNKLDIKKETPAIKSIKKNKSIENFMKFQWTWTI